MIEKVIKDRMEVVGLTQAKLSQQIGCTPTQLSLFLRGNASLNRRSLDMCFRVLGIQFDGTSKRIELARRVAHLLHNTSLENVSTMNRQAMISQTGLQELYALPEVSECEFEIMVSSGVGDYEATYPYFKTLVLHFMKATNGLTPKKAEIALNTLAATLIATPLIPVLGIGSIVGAAVGALAMSNKSFSKAIDNAWGPLTTLTINLFKPLKK